MSDYHQNQPNHPLGGPHPFDPDEDNDRERNAGALLMMGRAADELLGDPPSEMRGEYLDEQRDAWYAVVPGELSIRETIGGLVNELRQAGDTAMQQAGLIGRAGKAKCRQVRDAIADFLKLRTTQRAARMVHVCVNLLASLLSIVPGIEVVKEAFEGFKYLADLVLVKA